MLHTSVIPVGHLAPAGCWDENLIQRLLDNELYPTGAQFKHYKGYPNKKGCILIVPGQYWHERTQDINNAIASKDWVLLIRTGDEEDLFDVNQVKHPNIRFWIQTPRIDRTYPEHSRFIGVGFPPHFNNLPAEPSPKNLDCFLSGQNTHARRNECFAALKPRERFRVEQTAGFTQGMDPLEYVSCMVGAKVAPCPSGAVSPDSFRLYEALEAHAVPIADDVSPTYDSAGFWRLLFPDAPFPILTHYSDLPGYVQDQIGFWPANANRIAAWWMREQRRMAHNLVDDLTALGAL